MKIEQTELFQSMMSCGRYENKADVLEAFNAMVEDIQAGADPEEVLHEEGFEPDYVFDLIHFVTEVK